MAITISVETQGISKDWSTTTGNFEPISRGTLDQAELFQAMTRLALLDTPDTEDPCPPHLQTTGKPGDFSFVGQGGLIFCPGINREVTARQATDMAFGSPLPSLTPEKPAQHLAPNQKSNRPRVPPTRKKYSAGKAKF